MMHFYVWDFYASPMDVWNSKILIFYFNLFSEVKHNLESGQVGLVPVSNSVHIISS